MRSPSSALKTEPLGTDRSIEGVDHRMRDPLDTHPLYQVPPILSTLYDLWKIRRISKRLCLRKNSRSYTAGLHHLPGGIVVEAAIQTALHLRHARILCGMNESTAACGISANLFTNGSITSSRTGVGFLEEADSTICPPRTPLKRSGPGEDRSPTDSHPGDPCCVDPQLFHPGAGYRSPGFCTRNTGVSRQ